MEKLAAQIGGDIRDIPHDIQFAPDPIPDGPRGINSGSCRQCNRDDKACDRREPKCGTCRSSWFGCTYTTPSLGVDESEASSSSSPLSSPVPGDLDKLVTSAPTSLLGSPRGSNSGPFMSGALDAVPEATEPETAAPESAAPNVVTQKPAARKTEVKKAVARKVVATKVVASKPATAKAAVPKMAEPKAATSKPAVSKPSRSAKPVSFLSHLLESICTS